ncbi:MAG: hypothetical protein ACKOC5_14880 [Chloroflexota bacterium]
MPIVKARRELLFFAGYLALMSGLIFALLYRWSYDDPYITYRYARSLAEGQGFVYNAGQRVLSTTTVLMVFLLALVKPLPGDLPVWANLFGALSLALGGWLLWNLGRAWDAPVAGWLGLLFYPTFPILLHTLGSETPLALALGLLAFWAYTHRRYRLTGAAAALAVLARPDTLLVSALLGLHFLAVGRRQGERLPWAGLGLYLAILGLWSGFAWAYFGSPLPVTLAAKYYQGLMPISRRFLDGLLLHARGQLSQPYFVVYCLLAAAGLLFAVRRSVRREWLWLLAWPALYILAYWAMGITSYPWYYALPALGLLIAAGLGADGLWKLARRRLPQAAAWALAAALVGVCAWGQAAALWQQHTHPDIRAALYREIGGWLANNTPPDATVGVLEVGMVGYYSRRTMIDFAGLLQSDTGRQLLRGTYDETAQWAVQRYRPQYLVLQEYVLPELENRLAELNCHKVRRYRAGTLGYPMQITLRQCFYTP